MIGVATGDNNAAVLSYYQNLGIEFSAISGIEGGGNQINDDYQIGAYPTYILIAPDYSIVEQDIWPVPSTQTFITAFENNGLVQAPCSAVTADFTSDATEICQYDMVSYTDMSSGDVISWNWTFEGGDPATSTEQNPTVTYNETGTFDVTLEVSDGNETSTMMLEDYITVDLTPPAMLDPFDDVLITDPPFELTGGTPAGGVYSGNGVEDGWFYPDVAGLGLHTITYTYTASNGCDNSDEQTILVDESTGVPETGNEFVRIFPNPSNGIFEINIARKGEISIFVYNILGEKVYEMVSNSNGEMHETINLTTADQGVYFVSVQTNEDVSTYKINIRK